MFNVSRMTVNKALNNVAKKGFVERIRGSGSFVKLPDLEKQSVIMSSFTEQYEERGIHVSTKLLFYSVVKARDFPQLNLMKKLYINPLDMVHYFVRLRYGNHKPIAVQYTYVPVNRISVIDITSLNKSFYGYLENKLKLSLGNGKSNLSIVLPNEEIANHLHISKDTPVVLTRHVSCLRNGFPFEYVDTYSTWEDYQLNFFNKRDY